MFRRLLPQSTCYAIVDKESRLHCRFRLLYDITRRQDEENIRLIRDLDDDKDPRWLPLHIIDNANAIILEISNSEGINLICPIFRKN